MTTYASAPGTRLGGRYRLEDRIAAGSGWDAWKAIDETLARAVTVFTFATGFPRIGDVVTAARAASRLTDPRLAQVFDVEDNWDHAYIVMEWAAGETLGDLLLQAPLEPFRAARIIAEAAGALSSAHASGVAHMCLSPGSVRWSLTGEVKVVGLGIDAALSGITVDEPVLADTEGLGRLLYAALTAHWPGAEAGSLPPAPVSGGEPCSPRQVIAGIPLALSDLACRAMGLRSASSGDQLTSPGELAGALRAILPPAPPPAAPALTAWRDPASRNTGSWPRASQTRSGGNWPGLADNEWPADEEVSYAALARPDQREDYPQSRPSRSRPSRQRPTRQRPARAIGASRLPKVLVVTAGVLALAAIAAFSLWPSGPAAPTKPSPSASTPLTSVTLLRPAGATGFDPLTPSDTGNEDTQTAKYAIDASPQTSWNSQWYATADFGNLKAGSGLLVDMGHAVSFSSVSVTFNSQPGATVELLVGNSNARSKQNLDSMKVVGSDSNPVGNVNFKIKGAAVGRYLVVWFTKLPPAPGGGRFEAQVFNVAVRGTPAK
ncbi:MAG: protein kinase family protein [Streptosporangiaceae bacterium]